MIQGKNRIGFDLSAENDKTFSSFEAKTLTELPGNFHIATENEIEAAMAKAKKAFSIYKQFYGEKKASFLDAIADEIDALGDGLVERACDETGLTRERIISERLRTTNQLHMFASFIREGSWVDASIDLAIPDRKPFPKPDLRRIYIPIGPVVVFSASNFPLAYSSAGGDTASALAAGNPVIVKAHPSHAGTNFLVGEAINTVAIKTGMPDGVFSTLYSASYELGVSLVKHPVTAAVGFTGSFAGGTALFRAAMEREVPIPVFAEMGSTNPVILLPGKLETDKKNIAAMLTGSITNGSGQFCTKPGLIAAIKGPNLDKFIELLSASVTATEPQAMLNAGINKSYLEKTEKLMLEKGITFYVNKGTAKETNIGVPTLAMVDFEMFSKRKNLHEELFGPFSLVVKCNDEKEIEEFASLLQGQLTASVFADDDDIRLNPELFTIIREKAGRIILNGAPTGVEVCPSIQHGGPFPATTDGRFTSVGTDAIKRFVRPVTFQNTPQLLLPDELKDENPLNIWRRINGEFTKSKC